MDGYDLLVLRKAVSDAGMVYNKVMSECFTVLMDRKKAKGARLAVEYRAAAEQYRNALEKLLAYLSTLEPHPQVEAEKERTSKLLDALNHEVQTMSQQLAGFK